MESPRKFTWLCHPRFLFSYNQISNLKSYSVNYAATFQMFLGNAVYCCVVLRRITILLCQSNTVSMSP